jgi:hypothetical protein
MYVAQRVIRRDLRWRDECEAAGVTAKVIVCNDWLGSVVVILSEL